jgi:hypothetical protein
MRIIKKSRPLVVVRPSSTTEHFAVAARRQRIDELVTSPTRRDSYSKDMLKNVDIFYDRGAVFFGAVAARRWDESHVVESGLDEPALDALGRFYREFSCVIPFLRALRKSRRLDCFTPEALRPRILSFDISLRNRIFNAYAFDAAGSTSVAAYHARSSRYDMTSFPWHMAIASGDGETLVAPPEVEIIARPEHIGIASMPRYLRAEISSLDLELFPLLGGYAPHLDLPDQRCYVFGAGSRDGIEFIALDRGFIESFYFPGKSHCYAYQREIPNQSNLAPVWLFNDNLPTAMILGRIISPRDAFGGNASESEFLSHSKLLRLTDIYRSEISADQD